MHPRIHAMIPVFNSSNAWDLAHCWIGFGRFPGYKRVGSSQLWYCKTEEEWLLMVVSSIFLSVGRADECWTSATCDATDSVPELPAGESHFYNPVTLDKERITHLGQHSGNLKASLIWLWLARNRMESDDTTSVMFCSDWQKAVAGLINMKSFIWKVRLMYTEN
jgi:hypothetical protein